MTVAKDNHKEREAVIAKLTDVEDGLLERVLLAIWDRFWKR